MSIKNQKSGILCEAGCPCTDDCPLNKAMNLIGGKWKITILCALHTGGATRYNTLKRKIKGISNTMLAKSLQELEESGLVQRIQYEEMPLRVEYSTTSKCTGLMPILQQLAQWGMELTP